MSVGTSKGGYYDDSFHRAAAEWDSKYDKNEITPGQMQQNQQLESIDMTELGGIEVSNKTQMPFPDNTNPDSTFNARFGNLPPSGIMNDLKPQPTANPTLVRKISDVSSDIDDRSNQSFSDMLTSMVGEKFTMDRFNAIMQHPLAPVEQTMTANQPINNNSISVEAGSADLNKQRATQDLGLNQQEQDLYQRHINNLTGPGGVNNPPDEENPQGSRSTLYQSVQEHNGKYYNIPTVWDGKIETEKYTKPDGTEMDVPNSTALENVKRTGWDSFPSYATDEEADKRYDDMHKYMEEDTKAYLNQK